VNPLDYEDLSPLARIRAILLASSVTERVFFALLVAAAAVSALSLCTIAMGQTLVVAPREGGSLVEGVIGTPRFVNPVLAASDADRALTALVFAGLTRASAAGDIEPDLATYQISEDGLEYRFTIREGARFHDGEPVLAADVAFTVAKVQDPEVKSPRASAWRDIDVEVLSERDLVFRLPRPAPDFLLATTLGVLPAHRFNGLSAQDFLLSDANAEPVGAGPFEVEDLVRAREATVAYELSDFEAYEGAEPYLGSYVVRFYADERALARALEEGEVESAYGLSPEDAAAAERDGFRVATQRLPWIYAAFFNQSHAPVLADRDVRRALSAAIDRERLVDEVLKGYGVPLEGPISIMSTPAESLGSDEPKPAPDEAGEHAAEARAALEADGFKLGEDGVYARKGERLSLSLVTADAPELVAAAQVVAGAWRDAGAEVRVEVYAPQDLAEAAIRPREYDALLFGEVIGRDVDFYSFWHSSQRTDPGLNVAGYTNATVDGLLEDLRSETDAAERAKILARAAALVAEDVPAAFLYAPETTYAIPEGLEAPLPPRLASPSDRFALVRTWHRETDKVWPIFAR
jgi:peptide/nickel transport system substrate-binding protein